MKVLFVTPEISPFSKTSGIADVSDALSRHLSERGVSVDVFSPMYKSVKDNFKTEDTGIRVTFPVFRRHQTAYLRKTRVGEVTVFFVENDRYFYRPGFYGDERGDYHDNSERFCFFCRAVLELVKLLKKRYDVVHLNEWQAATVCAYLKTLYKDEPLFDRTSSVLTLHNLANQGIFDHWDFNFVGLPWEYFTWHYFEYYGKTNLLKGGIAFADKLNTVSPTYAKEIQTKEYGCGLEGVLLSRSKDLVGILNGCDYEQWNPEKDSSIPANYSEKKMDGKKRCKESLQKLCEFDADERLPLIGIISHLTEQKGFDLLEESLKRIEALGVRLIVLGVGEKRYEEMLLSAHKQRPQFIRVFLQFDEKLAHLIEAGSDMFLMPSRYEPCGSNQMYSMRYGTVPIARKTGGLADTIVSYPAPDATGFLFDDYSSDSLCETLKSAVELFLNQPHKWKEIVSNGMRKRFLWEESAEEYLRLYKAAMNKRELR
ncbi:MAG: glycogen synthase GlgA [Planctomycetota bacterium]|nr:glycogen synthase GlgA [Planctomycetota bacterium]